LDNQTIQQLNSLTITTPPSSANVPVVKNESMDSTKIISTESTQKPGKLAHE
jgi:hypothetical protein